MLTDIKYDVNNEILDPNFAQSLVDIVAAELNKNVNIVGAQGVIIASFSKERIGQVHEASARMIQSGKIFEFLVTAEDEQRLSGVRRGFNVPIFFENKYVGFIGVTGEPEEAAAYARLAARFVEAALQSNKRQEKLIEAMKEKQKLQLKYLQKIITIQENERRNISRELHDETSQSLTSVIFGLRVLSESCDPQTKEKLIQMRDRVGKALDGVHRLATQLHPALLDDLGLISAIRKYAEDFSKQYNIAIHLEIDESLRLIRFTHKMKINLYRFIQESLTNTAKYAQATEVHISLRNQNSNLVLSICDNGVGFDAETIHTDPDRTCLGIYGMKERIELLRGKFTIHSEPGRGTHLSVDIPLRKRINKEK